MAVFGQGPTAAGGGGGGGGFADRKKKKKKKKKKKWRRFLFAATKSRPSPPRAGRPVHLFDGKNKTGNIG